jgi:RNA polymerase sigma-70 factor (ECF subfamily)
MSEDHTPSNPPLSAEDRRKAVQALFLRNQTTLRGLILGMLPDVNRAEDLLQDVFFVVTDKASSFELGTNFIAWAMQIARYRLKELVRKDIASGRTLTPDLIDRLVETYQPNDRHEAMLRQLSFCIERLTPSTRQLLTLRYHGRLKPAQIASERDLSVQTVYSVLSKTRSALRDCIERRMKASEDVR